MATLNLTDTHSPVMAKLGGAYFLPCTGIRETGPCVLVKQNTNYTVKSMPHLLTLNHLSSTPFSHCSRGSTLFKHTHAHTCMHRHIHMHTHIHIHTTCHSLHVSSALLLDLSQLTCPPPELVSSFVCSEAIWPTVSESGLSGLTR